MDYFGDDGLLGCFIGAFVLVVATVLMWVSETFSPQAAMLVALIIYLLMVFLPAEDLI